MIPRVSIARWDGQGDGQFFYAGWSVALEWLGLIIEINFGRAEP